MTINGLCKKLAENIVFDRAFHNNRFIFASYQYTESDLEEMETLRSQIFNLFYRSNGRKWANVFSDLKRICGSDSFIGFKAQDKIIATCANYGINFEV